MATAPDALLRLSLVGSCQFCAAETEGDTCDVCAALVRTGDKGALAERALANFARLQERTGLGSVELARLLRDRIAAV